MSSMVVHRPNSSVPSSSFTPPTPWRYEFDVFLSFRGEDTRDNFVDHLHKELCLKGIHTFRDDKKLQTGEEIGPELSKAIEQSRFSIVVFSKNYASSRWCLNELVKIMECNATTTTVYPVFYHVDPSEVRNQTGDFGKGLEELLSKYDSIDIDQVHLWRDALKKVANLKGWPYPSATIIRSETKFIEDLVWDIFCKLDRPYPRGTDYLVGMLSRVEKVVELLGLGSDEAHIIGIWGMGGIGKTSIARAVCDHISWQFEGCSFLENVRENSKKYRGRETLQEKLISDILVEVDFKVRDIDHGRAMIKNRVGCKKVLIVLDDVDSSTDLEDIFGDFFRLPLYSKNRIIITTRDQHTLTTYDARHIYKVEELGKDEAVELFMSKAFGKHQPTKGFEEVLDRAIEHAKGLPLALKVLGSSLKGRSKGEWESALNRLRENKLRESDDEKVERVLKISYDALAREDKKIFLDIACFFKGENKYWVMEILDSCGFNPEIGINNLVEKSLVTISKHNKLSMHDLIQQLGQNIVHYECPEEPGERSRLWLYDDIKHVLMHHTGTNKVEVIILEGSSIGQLELSPEAFEKMTNLRIFKIHGGNISEDLKYLSNKLRLLDWGECPLKYMPSRFQPEHLVEFHMTNSPIKQLWKGVTPLPKLKFMNLSYCNYLTESPNFAEFPTLVVLMLRCCTSLVNLCPSLGHLRRLMCLDLGNCENLKSLPIGFQESLLELTAFGCPKLKTILGSFEHMKRLLELNLRGSGIEDLPQSVANLTDLRSMDLSYCKNLRSIPNCIGQLTNLKNLYLGHCNLKFIPSDICSLHSLKYLDLSGNDFESLPSEMNQLSELCHIELWDCKKLKEIPELSSNIESIEAGDCESLTRISHPFINPNMKTCNFENCLKLVENGQSNILLEEFLAYQFQCKFDRDIQSESAEIIIPGSEISEWFNYESMGPSLSFQLPDRIIFQITFCFVIELQHQQYTRNQKILLFLKFGDGTSVIQLSLCPRFIRSSTMWIIRIPKHSIMTFKQSDGFGIEIKAALLEDRRKEPWHVYCFEECVLVPVIKGGARVIFMEDLPLGVYGSEEWERSVEEGWDDLNDNKAGPRGNGSSFHHPNDKRLRQDIAGPSGSKSFEEEEKEDPTMQIISDLAKLRL